MLDRHLTAALKGYWFAKPLQHGSVQPFLAAHKRQALRAESVQAAPAARRTHGLHHDLRGAGVAADGATAGARRRAPSGRLRSDHRRLLGSAELPHSCHQAAARVGSSPTVTALSSTGTSLADS
jgi:hypothetical protein